ncbi:UNVERIFIED_ORG: hypothetical protein J2791_005737 [Burkholderia contaminans]|nr:hypothetical protein [Burkholderia contaminans]
MLPKLLRSGIDGIWNGSDVGNWNAANGFAVVAAVAARAGSAKPRQAFSHASNICCIGWTAWPNPALPAEVPA